MSPFYFLEAQSLDVAPGPVTVTADAVAIDGSVIAQQQLSISLVVEELLTAPLADDVISSDNPLNVEFVEVPTATEYCVTVSQGALTQPQCGEEPSQVFLTGILVLLGFEPGPVDVSASVNRDDIEIGSQAVTVTLQ